MKRVLLVAPPFYRLMGSHYNGLHLGIAYIGAVIREHGFDVQVYNADYQDSTEYANQRQLFESFTQYKAILDAPGHPIWQEIKEKVAGFAPDIIGISMLTANYKAAKIIAGLSKTINPEVRVVVGGTHPTLDPDGTLAVDEIDYVIRNEGEFAFLELVQGRPESEIKGLSYKKNGELQHNEARSFISDLDSLPFPMRDGFLNNTDYLEAGNILTARGCPFSCSYCASQQIWGRVVRFRSVDNVMAELEYVTEKFSPGLIHFVDDTFNLYKERAKELCQCITDCGLKPRWVCEARVNNLDKELVSLMVKAGCVRIKLGVESGSDRILKMVRKGFTTEEIRQGIAIVKECQLPITAYLMVGFPGETNEDLRKTIDLAKEIDADYYSLSVLAPYYGTELWKDLENSGRKLDKEHWEYFYHQSQDMIVNSELDPAMVDEFLALNERDGKRRMA